MMDDGGQRENERHKIDQYKSIQAQWMGTQHHLKDNQSVKLIVAERDKAFQERDLALAEKKAAIVERDMAILQRDSAIAERNTAIMERDNAIGALEYARENGGCPNCGPGPGAQRRTKHVYHQQQHHLQHLHPQPSQLTDAAYNPTRETQYEGFHMPTTSENGVKSPKTKRPRKDTKAQPSALKNPSKAPRKSKKGGNDNLNKQVTIAKATGDWRTQVGVGEDLNKQVSVSKHQQWKTQDLGLNEVTFDESMMPSPVCSCTGKYQQCYKWGNGGWQSACCTMTLSMYPLPQMPNKRHARVGGRKMSGSAFKKLLSRLAADGHDLSLPVDLKDHWAKHGTNRYITIK